MVIAPCSASVSCHYVVPPPTTRVLLVEKDRIVRELLEATLTRPGRMIDSASSVKAALQIAASSSTLDVALIENSMPDGSGIELGQHLRALDSSTEILLMSAAPSLESVLEAIESGATEYLPKPFDDINQLVLRIGAAEERARLRREGKWLHNALVESEERYRKLFAATPDAVIVFNAQSLRIEDANPAALRLYCYERHELVGQPVTLLRGGCSEEPTGTSTVPTLSHPRPPGILLRRDERRDGTAVDVELVIGRFHVGGQDMVVEIIRDIGDRLREQRERSELENQLRQSQKLEALGRLAGGVAHDFNNLLAVILNYAQFVSDGLAQLPAGTHTSQLSEDIEQIQRAATSATSVTRQLLAFSRRELVQMEVVDVNAIVTNTERLLRGTLGPNIEFRLKLVESLACVRIDRGQLEQVLVNLVVNARDAMPHGGTLTIATRQAETRSTPTDVPAPSTGWLELEVSDTGLGIDNGVLDKIFEPFFTTKDRDRGTGLGLAMVKGIVEHAGGQISVTTQLGVGSSFCISLPTTRESPEKKSRSNAPLRLQANEERILVVDDDQAVRRALKRILVSAGYRVVAASSGAEAIAQYDRLGTSVDLVVTDVLMAGMSGEELVTRLRQRQPGLKVIFATGYATMTVVDLGNEQAQRAFLPKPFDQRRLLEVVGEVLQGGSAHALDERR